jgi:hypothetical protein
MIEINIKQILQDKMMKINSWMSYVFITLFALSLISCEDVIQLDVAKTTPFLVVDGTITNVAGTQVIKLSESQDLLDQTIPKGIKNASVKVTDNLGRVYEFRDLKSDGNYVWTPSNSTDIMGVVGRTYTLEIKADAETYRAVSALRRVPKIDSIVYKLDSANLAQKGSGKPNGGYDVQFYAIDPVGVGDCYRVKVFQNGKLRNTPNNIIIAYDAIANKAPVGDGLMLTLPIRSIASTELFKENDKLRVELSSITEANFDFWLRLSQELNNTGLFARPSARIPSNIVNTNSNSLKLASGWFGTSAISSMEVTINKNKAVKEFNN